MSVVVCSALSELLVPGAGLAGSDACSPFLNSRCASPIDRASFGSLLLPKSSTTMSRMNSTFSGPSSMLEPYTDTAVPRSDRLVTRTGHLTADPPDRVGYCAVTGEAVAASRAASSAAWAGVFGGLLGALGRLVGRIGVRGGGRDGSGRRGGLRPWWPSSGRLTPGVTEHHADHGTETETEAGGDADGCDGSRPDSSEIERGCSELSCSKRHVRPRRGPGRNRSRTRAGASFGRDLDGSTI